jgi:predicted alpha/beta hydrolase family esterase
MKLAQKLMIGYFRTKLRVLSVLSKRKAAKSAFKLFCTPLRRSGRRTPAIFNQGEALQFVLNGCTVHGHRWKSSSSKKILIVHGFESSSRNFDRYISALINKGYEVIAFDAPAHGKSTGTQINLPDYLATIIKINELYGPLNGFIAHSFGGLAVAHFLETIPDNESIKAVLIAPATETITTINSFFDFLRLSKEVRTEFDRLIYERSGFYPGHFSVKRAMQHIKAEVLWFHDEDDELTPVQDALNVMKEGFPNIQFRITKGLGHRRIYRDNNVLNEIVDFL